jgi:hypothetical protein
VTQSEYYSPENDGYNSRHNNHHHHNYHPHNGNKFSGGTASSLGSSSEEDRRQHGAQRSGRRTGGQNGYCSGSNNGNNYYQQSKQHSSSHNYYGNNNNNHQQGYGNHSNSRTHANDSHLSEQDSQPDFEWNTAQQQQTLQQARLASKAGTTVPTAATTAPGIAYYEYSQFHIEALPKKGIRVVCRSEVILEDPRRKLSCLSSGEDRAYDSQEGPTHYASSKYFQAPNPKDIPLPTFLQCM